MRTSGTIHELWPIISNELLAQAIPRENGPCDIDIFLCYFIMKTSCHLECASIMIKNILSMNGPKKSTCTRSHAEVGPSHG